MLDYYYLLINRLHSRAGGLGRRLEEKQKKSGPTADGVVGPAAELIVKRPSKWVGRGVGRGTRNSFGEPGR